MDTVDGHAVVWTNTLGTYMDAVHSNKFINYKGIPYLAQCLSYAGEIKPKPAEFIFETVERRINRDQFLFRHFLRTLMPAMYGPRLSEIKAHQENDTDPFWANGYFAGVDARAAYAITTELKPKRIIEVGSGNSTKWFRKAIKDASRETILTSIDPVPRADIARIADEVVESSIVDVDLTVFDRLHAGDVLFCDGSHVCFNGSDVCSLFLEVLPRLSPGVLVHVHDVSLPFAGFRSYKNVPEELSTHSQSEQLMLATFLLNSLSAKVLLPVFFLSSDGAIPEQGASFWFISG